WDQFDPTGDINPSLPHDSPWKAIGPPLRLDQIRAGAPQVASWRWRSPLPPDDHPLHYCIAVFVHSASAPLTALGPSLDEAAARSAHVSQKNLHIMPVLVGG